jgi:hypothetical protein
LSRRARLIDTLILVLLAVALVGPVFKVKYLDNWPSIESTFISDGRLLAEHLPHPGWQPLWYCGTRFDYIYPPALRYGTALISVAGHLSTAKAYHIYIGLLYVFGIAAVYWLVMMGGGSRRGAWLTAAAVAMVSPSLILFRILHDNSPWMVPQRLHALMLYGEGPHISALSVLPAALAATFVAVRDGSRRGLAMAGVFCALTVANNFYGATALAMFFPVAVWSVWAGTREGRVWRRAAGIVGLAFGLSAAWLTPSYIAITGTNLRWVATPGDLNSRLVMLAAIVIFCDVSWRWTNRVSGDERRLRIWPSFVGGSALILSVYVIGFFWAGLRILGEPGRLAPELDFALLLLAVLVIDRLWASGRMRVEAVVLGVLLFAPAVVYLQHAYSPFPRAANWETQYERRMTKWVWENLRGERVLPSGTNRFWYDAWFDNAQPTGGSEQGLLNQILPIASYQLYQNQDPAIVTMWMQALGTSAMIVPDATSFERYHDFAKPEIFRGKLEALFDDGHGTVIYRVPRVHPGIGRVVDGAKVLAIGELTDGDDLDRLRPYVAMVEAPQPATTVEWSGFDRARVRAEVGPGQSVLVQETYDPEWRAYAGGRRVPVKRDPVMGFMLLETGPGQQQVEMRFETPMENRAGGGLVLGSLGLVGWMMIGRGRATSPRAAGQGA